MKILVVHNAYQQRGGEDMVVDAEIELLRAHGHEVALFAQHNDAVKTMSRMELALGTVWSRKSAGRVAAEIERFAPDVMHVHNTFPLISPSIYWTASQHNVPIIQTLHNFRLLCPQAIFLRDGKICEDCLGKTPWRAIPRKCYRDSAAQTTVLTGMLTAHRMLGTFQHHVTRYIALNEFARNKYIEGGLPAHRLRIKPNFVESQRIPQWHSRSGGLYVGRLSEEKGIQVLNAAAALVSNAQINVIGTGPFDSEVRQRFGNAAPGFLPLPEILNRMHSARYLVLPSICYDNFPRTLVEAFASGLPVIASRLGALADLVQDGVTGLHFEAGNATDLAEKIRWAETNPAAMERMGRAARQEYEIHFSPNRNHELLIDIYEDAIAECQRSPCIA